METTFGVEKYQLLYYTTKSFLQSLTTQPINTMTEKVIDSGATGFLVLIIPIALVAVVVATAWPFLLALLALIVVVQVLKQWQWQRFVGKVNPAFNQLIRENNGCLTPVDLAAKADIEGNKAQEFLDYKANQFSARSRELPNQGRVYYFLTASAVENFFEEPESLETLEVDEDEESAIATVEDRKTEVATEANGNSESSEINVSDSNGTGNNHLPEAVTEDSTQTVSLIQAELARRLQVHSSTVGQRKLDPDFAQWTRKRDPEKISWQYSDQTKLFYPLDE